MLYAIRWTNPGGVSWWLLPACFDDPDALKGRPFLQPTYFHPADRQAWIADDSPALSRKFSSAGDAALACESMRIVAEVVPLPGTGNAYELPMDPRAAEDLAYRILAPGPPASAGPPAVMSSPASLNGKAP